MNNELTLEKTMTVKEIAQAMGVSTDTVKNCIRRIMPEKMQNGKTTFLNEQEVTMISKELKSNTFVSSHQTYEVSSQVKNTTTRLEVLANYKAATQAMIELLEAEKAELQAQKYVDRGYFRVIETPYSLPDGTQRINLKTVVFQKGVDFIRKVIKQNLK